MATQICPACNKDSFTWTHDEDRTTPTTWGCECGYSAREDESFERVCVICNIKTESRLEDDDKIYWWCCSCNTTTLITRVPKWRFPTGDAIQELAAEFEYPFDINRQDWEYIVPTIDDIEKYFTKYATTNSEDIRFLLMIMMLETSNSGVDLKWIKNIWPRVMVLLKEDFQLHEYTMFYYCCWDNEDINDAFFVTPYIREFWGKQ
ncbi:hypothetical protein DVR12_16115 [Chitinophaga silvatica]|uniref:Uncharacterized protein n=1 Tax=Chitinophaga silvatica TaxID=2282649 RepID=A0A3E1Y882_9BACT|nr:hypothetical protein [Chitinophaga silvatica]RFS21422.1 hypothetical protein DVR12_16115 [Chitinophaga silvatica]